MRDHPEFEAADREETWQLVPQLSGARVAELGGGIGRFTGRLSRAAAHVTCIELVPEFIEINRARHQALANIDFALADVMDAHFEENSLEFVFANWILLYLSDKEMEILVKRMAGWLTAQGKIFFRETCSPLLTRPTPGNPAHYRPHALRAAFHKYHSSLALAPSVLASSTYTSPFPHWLYTKKLT
jgi:phosphoethanolamine N-methyltransferase